MKHETLKVPMLDNDVRMSVSLDGDMVAFANSEGPVIKILERGDPQREKRPSDSSLLQIELAESGSLHTVPWASDTPIVRFGALPSTSKYLAYACGVQVFVIDVSRLSTEISDPQDSFNTGVIATWASHSLSISDIAWCPQSQHVMATSAKDGLICFYDMREKHTHKPSQAVSTFGALSIISWNRCKWDTLASVEENTMQLWDLRNLQMNQFTHVHDRPIVSVDWSHTNE